MTLRNTFRVLLLKWYITIPGLLLSLALAGATFVLAPPQYSSNAIAVLVQPKLTGRDAPVNANPLLNFDNSLSTTALILVQALDTPEAAASIGLYPGGDSYTIKDVGDVQVGDQIVQPFIYIKSEASTPDGAAAIVDGVLGMAAQDLQDRQRSLKVLQQNYVKLDDVVPPSPPQPVLGIALGATGAALILGLIATWGCAMWSERRSERRRAHRESEAAEAAEAAELAELAELASSNGSTSSPDAVDAKAGSKVRGKAGGNNGATVEPDTDDHEPKSTNGTKGTNGSKGRNGTRTPALVSSPALASSSFTPDSKQSSNGTGRQ
jgi:hypothetical protein